MFRRRRIGSTVAVAAVAAVALIAFVGDASAGTLGGTLAITILPGGEPVRQAGILEFHVTVTSSVPVAAVAIHVALDRDREQAIHWGSSSANVPCTMQPVSLDCRLPQLGAGESVHVTLQARVGTNATGTILTQATATGGDASVSADTTSAIDTRYPRPADLRLSLGSSAGGRQGATWTWRITNKGPGTAAAPTFDEASALGSAIPISVSTRRGKCSVSGTDGTAIHCVLGSISPGRTVTITIHAPSYTESGIKLIERPSVASSSPDPVPANNGAGLPVKVPLRASTA